MHMYTNLHTRRTTCVHQMGFRDTAGSGKWMKYILDDPLGYYIVDELYVWDFAVA
jgi:hypothetical protein